jgi:hypothetical protein
MYRRSVLAPGLLFALIVALAAPAAAQSAAAPAEAASLARIAICTGVEDRAPVGEAESFPSSVGQLSCFTKVVNAAVPTKIFHRWYVGDRLVDEIPINVKGKSWRCWSHKTIYVTWSGPCHVEVVTESGDVLGTKAFTLTAAMSEASGE